MTMKMPLQREQLNKRLAAPPRRTEAANARKKIVRTSVEDIPAETPDDARCTTRTPPPSTENPPACRATGGAT